MDGERSRADQRRVEQGRLGRSTAQKSRARQSRADQTIGTIILSRWLVFECMILCVHMSRACASNVHFIPSSSHHRRPACMLPRDLSLRASRSIARLGASTPASQIFSRIEKLTPLCSAHLACNAGEERCKAPTGPRARIQRPRGSGAQGGNGLRAQGAKGQNAQAPKSPGAERSKGPEIQSHNGHRVAGARGTRGPRAQVPKCLNADGPEGPRAQSFERPGAQTPNFFLLLLLLPPPPWNSTNIFEMYP